MDPPTTAQSDQQPTHKQPSVVQEQPEKPQPEQQTAAPTKPVAVLAAAAAVASTEAQECWTPTYIPLPVVDETETVKQGHEVLVDINFATLIGTGARSAKDDSSKRHYLSAKYSYNSADFRKQQVAPLFQTACQQAGFEIVMKGWEEQRQMIRFACQRNRLYKTKANNTDESKAQSSNVQRKRPLTQKCPFNFSVYWEKGQKLGTGRWFVCACGMGKCLHEGHAPKQYQEEHAKLSPHDVAFQKFLPQYQQFCLLAASGDLYQMDYAEKLLQETIYKLQAKAPPKKRKRGRKPKVDKDVQFSSLQGMVFPVASLPTSSVPSTGDSKPGDSKPAASKPKPPPQAVEDRKMPAATNITQAKV